MGILPDFVSLLALCLVTCQVAHSLETSASTASTGLMQLCLGTLPDGTAILTDTLGQREVLALFKYDKFWLRPVDDVVEFIRDKSNLPWIELGDQMDSATIWPNFPTSPDYIVSFGGLDRNNSFYNNVLVFKNFNLYRYRVDELDIHDATKISATLIGKYTTDYWSYFPLINDVIFIRHLRGSRVLFVLTRQIWYDSMRLYVLNDHNLNNPIDYNVRQYEIPSIDKEKHNIRQIHDIASPSRGVLTFLSTGKLCLNSTCKSFSTALSCPRQTTVFTKGFAYWIWQDTNFTIRLLIVALISIMVINITLASAFVFNQVKRVADLT